MSFSTDFFSRILGAIAAGIGGGFLGDYLDALLQAGSAPLYVIVFALLGVLVGLVLTPYVTVRPLRAIRHRLAVMPPERLVAVIAGIFLGLVAAALFSLPLALLPPPFRHILPLVAAVLFCYLSVVILTMRQNDLKSFLSSFRPVAQQSAPGSPEDFILLDTSVIIDGRIHDISQTGFLRGTMLVPEFVLTELQHIADSSDPIRRNRGRRGLEILTALQEEPLTDTRITDMDVSEVHEVDSKLVALARHLHCPIMTTDYNLNRVSEIQGIPVLNVNDLANAVKVAYLPGEPLDVKIIQEGREEGQGVGYLEDGTMVVVEDGLYLMDQKLTVTVTKVLQTSAGRMIFAKP